MSRAAEEFQGIDLGDQRLNRCAMLLAERLAEEPTASIPGTLRGLGGNPSGLSLLSPMRRIADTWV